MAAIMSAASNEPAPVHIDVVSDVVCPWCYIGKHRLERALTLAPDTPAEVEFRPYFLNPWLPRFDAKEARGLPAFDAAPELALGRNNQVLVERIGMGGDLDPFAAARDY